MKQLLNFFPLSKQEAVKKGYQWKNEDKREYKPSSYIIPDDIQEVQDDIINAVLACSSCGKNYRIIKQELAFYRKFGIPVPRKCPGCRHTERVAFRSPMRLTLRDCNKCGKKLKSNITSEISPIIYCDACYLEEVL